MKFLVEYVLHDWHMHFRYFRLSRLRRMRVVLVRFYWLLVKDEVHDFVWLSYDWQMFGFVAVHHLTLCIYAASSFVVSFVEILVDYNVGFSRNGARLARMKRRLEIDFAWRMLPNGMCVWLGFLMIEYGINNGSWFSDDGMVGRFVSHIAIELMITKLRRKNLRYH